MPKMIVLLIALAPGLLPAVYMEKNEDLLLFMIIYLLELAIVITSFKRFSISTLLVIPLAILSGLLFSVIFWTTSAILGMQKSGPSQLQEICSYLLMISFSLVPALHITLKVADYLKGRKYLALAFNSGFSFLYLFMAVSYL